MASDIQTVWRVLRPTIKEKCTFSGLKDLVAEAALPVEELGSLQQSKNDSKAELFDAINQLNDSQKTVLILCKIEQKSQVEVAEIMQLSASAVESLLGRAKAKLAEKLNSKGSVQNK